MKKGNPQLDTHFSKSPWRKELELLRSLLLESEATEELKWGKPCYTFQGKNLMMLYGLKESCAIAFFNGALLKDPKGILVKPGPNTQAGRWIRFTSLGEIEKLQSTVGAYIRESIAAAKSGKEVIYKKTPEPVPEELQRKMDKVPALKAAFNALTPGRQRGYILFISAAKQSQTRESRIEKCMPDIFKGKGLNDR